MKRGLTPAVVRRVEWERDETGVGVLSGRGTIREFEDASPCFGLSFALADSSSFFPVFVSELADVYLLNPQGGSPQGHLQGKVLNSKLLVSLPFLSASALRDVF